MSVEETAKSELSDLDQKIIRQIEYYFGDFNVRRDKFIREEIKKDDGWIPLSILTTFQRLKALSEDFETICSALKKSTTGLLEIDEEANKIRRSVNKPVPEEPIDNDALDAKSLYVKGFKRDATLDQLLDWFKPYNSENIQMRRFPKDRQFKGSVFVSFPTPEDAEKFLELKGVKYEGTELLKEKKKDYWTRKQEEIKQFKEAKELKAAKRMEEEKSKITAPSVVPGALLKLTEIKEDVMREDIQEVLRDFGTVAFIDFKKGDEKAIVRFDKGVAAEVIEKAGKGDNDNKIIEIKTSKAIMSVVEGDEEKAFWDAFAERSLKARMFFSKGNRPSRGRFNNKYKGKRHGRGDNSEERPSKKQKSENGN